MRPCLLKLHAELRDFDTTEVTSAADAYRSRGKADQEANVAAIEDHLRDLRQQRVKIERQVVDAWKERDPEGHAQAERTRSNSKDGGAEPFFARQAKADVRDLIVQHNLSTENLMHAARMGGLAVPSLAITKVDLPLKGFGEVTLIGPPQMADPRGYARPKVFASDVYSPRHPEISYRLDNAALKKLNDILAPYQKEGRNVYSDSVRSVRDLRDVEAFRAYVKDKLGDGWLTHQADDAAAEMLRKVGATEHIFQGFDYNGNRRYRAYTLDNVVKILKKELRGGESAGNIYGMGQLRAKFAPQFRSLESIKKAKDLIVSEEKFEAVKKEVENDFFAVSNDLRSYYDSKPDPFRFSDTVMALIEDTAKMGFDRAAKEYGFSDVPQDVRQSMYEFMTRLRNMPSEYFEAKILRSVDLSEFSAAVVPSDLPAAAREALESRGVRIYEYAKGDEAARAAAIKQAAQERNALFRRAQEPSGHGMSADAVRAGLEPFTARSRTPVRVHQSVEDMRKVAGLKDTPDGARGAYLNGTIHVVADSHADLAAVERTVARHEVTHAGIDALYGSAAERKAALLAIAAKNQKLRRFAEQLQGRLDLNRLDAIEESLAHSSEDLGNTLNGWKAFVAVIQKGLRAMGLNRAADWLERATNAEVMAFLNDARLATEQDRPRGGLQPAFARKESLDLTGETEAEIRAREAAEKKAAADKAKRDKAPSSDSFTLTGSDRPVDVAEAHGQKPLFARAQSDVAPEWVAKQSQAMQETLRKAGAWRPKESLQDRIVGWTDGWQAKMRQGMVDQFDPIKALDYKAYMLARMSKSSAGPLETMLHNGTIFMDRDGAIDVNLEKGGFVAAMQKLQGEHDRFFSWVIGNRAERLLAEGKEHNLTAEDVKRLKSLAEGTMANGKSRAAVYFQANADLQRYNKAAIDLAEKAGLIDKESRPYWEKDFYIPFYRALEDDKTSGPMPKKGLVRQYAFKALKGGAEVIGDPMENVLKNWAHLIDASLKNNAARAAILAAEKAGVALEAKEEDARQMAKLAGKKDAVVYFMDEGEQRHFVIDDPFVLDAVNSLAFTGFSGPAMKVMSSFKRWLTYGVTISPTFRIRNVIRDSIQMIGTNPASYNVLDNVLTGIKLTGKDNPVYASMLAGGGVMRFGTMESEAAAHVKRLIDAGVDESTILDSPEKMKGMLTAAYDWWMQVGDRAENINRAALYQKLRDEGKSHLEASYAARDSMDFSMQGTWSAIRFLAQTVPFFNARLQGLYKLGRGAAEDPRRFAYVVGASALASVALLLAFKDDDDWKKREDWDRETYWWFKIGDKAFRIPKPFEIGVLATLAERGVEAMATDELSGKRFAQRAGALVMQQLSMNPVPQMFMPMVETWANKDTFTNRPIESPGMERLSPENRVGPNTSAFAQLAGKNGVISPTQIDHLVSGYFGWLGTHAVATVDMALRPAMGLPGKPAPRINDVLVLGDFVKDAQDYQSGYLTRLYEQAKDVQEVMADVHHFQKIGAIEKARETLDDNRDKLKLYALYTNAEKQLKAVNERIRMVQVKDADPEAKRQQLDMLNAMKNRIAQLTEERARQASQ